MLNWLRRKGIAKLAIFVALMSIMTTSLGSPAYAQESGSPGGWDIIGDMFTFENEKSFEERKADFKAYFSTFECVTCKLFDGFSGAIFDVSGNVDGAGPGLIPVLTGFASVFALFYLGSAFVSGDASDLLGRWQVFWRLCLAVAAGSVFLSAPLTNSWNFIFGPLFSIGEGVVAMVGGSSGSCGGSISSNAPAGAVSALQSMSRTVCGSYEMTIEGLANGMALMTQKDGLVNTFTYFVFGLLTVMMYGFLALTFPLRFIDVVIRLAIVGMITPILTLCAVFKPTRGYVSIAISNVLNATAQFAILSVIFKIGDTVFTKLMSEMNLSSSSIQSGGEGSMMEAFGNSLVLFGIAFVFSGMVRAVPAIAAEFARHSGGGGDVGGNAATMVVAAPAAGAAAVAGLATGGVGKLAMKGGGKAWGAMKGAGGKGGTLQKGVAGAD